MVECSNYFNTGEFSDPLIRVYKNQLKEGVPLLVFEGGKIQGANSRIELEAFIKSRILGEFLREVETEKPDGESYIQDLSNCEFIQKGYWGKFLGVLGLRRVKCV